MSGDAKYPTGPERELKCSRCYKRESCVQCCGTRFCLRQPPPHEDTTNSAPRNRHVSAAKLLDVIPCQGHFHTSDHASDHPRKAFVMNKPAFDDQLPAFQEMWREAFQSVAEDVDRISREIGKRVADDPLASIGMVMPEKLSAAGKKSSGKSREGAGSLSAGKRRKTEGKDGKKVEASDPFTRRRTRPTSYWAVGGERDSTQKAGVSTLSASSSNSAAAAAATPSSRKGEYQCEACSSEDTSFDIIGGASDGSRKGETFGKKDAPELVLRVICHACGNSWLEER